MEKLEAWILLIVHRYERHQNKFIDFIEYVVSAAIWKDLLRVLLTLLVEISPPNVADRFDKLLISLSRESNKLKNGEKQGWTPRILLKEKLNVSARDINIAFMRRYLTNDGEIDILLKLERQRAFSAAFVISIILCIYLAFLITIWTAVNIDVSITLIALQIGVFLLLSIILLSVVTISSYVLFFHGIVPLATTHRFMQARKELMYCGVPVQIR